MGLLAFSCTNAQEKEGESVVKEYSAKEIIKIINKGKEVIISNAIIKDDLIFSEVEDTDFTSLAGFTANVNVNIFFQGCVFMGDVKSVGKKKVKEKKINVKTRFGKDVNFTDCDFRKNVDFSEAEFSHTVNFAKSIFRGHTQFNNIYCLGQQNQWWEIEADSTFLMCNSTFLGNVNMMDAKFQREFTLQGLSINNLQISNIIVEEKFDFSLANVQGYLICNYGQFNGDAILSYGRFLGRADITNSHFHQDFEIKKSLFYGLVKLNKTTFSKKISTEQSHFMTPPDTEGIQYQENNAPDFGKFQ